MLLVPLMFPAGLIGAVVGVGGAGSGPGDPNAHGKTLLLDVNAAKPSELHWDLSRDEQTPYTVV